jgi:hypothetical protein
MELCDMMARWVDQEDEENDCFPCPLSLFQAVGLLVVSFLSGHALLPLYLLPTHTYRRNLAGSRKDSSSGASRQLHCGPP